MRRTQEKYYELQAKAKLSKGKIFKFLNIKSVKSDITYFIYEPELHLCMIKWENDIQYFEKFTSILTSPR